MNLASSFYTNVVEYKGKLLIRGVNNGQSYLSRINYSPKLYLPTKEESKYKTLDSIENELYNSSWILLTTSS